MYDPVVAGRFRSNLVVRAVTLCSVICAFASALASTGTVRGTIPSASSGEHLWFVIERPPAPGLRTSEGGGSEQQFEIRQVSAEMDAPHFTSHFALIRPPDFIAAVGRQVFFVMSPERREVRRNVYSLELQFSEAMNGYFTTPPNRLGVEESITVDGELVAVTGHRDGLMALLLPDGVQRTPSGSARKADDDVTNPNPAGARDNGARDDAASDDGARDDGGAALRAAPGQVGELPHRQPVGPITEPALLQLTTAGWTPIDLPTDFSVGRNRIAQLQAFGEESRRLALLTEDRASPHRSVLYQRSATGEWSSSTIDLDPRDILWLTRSGQQVAAVIKRGQERLSLELLANHTAVHVASLDRPEEPWTLLGMEDRFLLIVEQDRAAVAYRTIDSVSGDVSGLERLLPHEAQFLQMQTILAVALLMGMVLVVILMRPPVKVIPLTMEQAPPAPLSVRIAALMIDFALAAVPALLLTRTSPADLLLMPVFEPSLERSLPYLITAGLTTVHCATFEAISGASIGKHLLGLRLITYEGRKPQVGAVLLRALGKLLLFLVPPVTLFIVFSQRLQGINDLLGRTLVIRRADADRLRDAPPEVMMKKEEDENREEE